MYPTSARFNQFSSKRVISLVAGSRLTIVTLRDHVTGLRHRRMTRPLTWSRIAITFSRDLTTRLTTRSEKG